MYYRQPLQAQQAQSSLIQKVNEDDRLEQKKRLWVKKEKNLVGENIKNTFFVL